jgi:hypothetical protein
MSRFRRELDAPVNQSWLYGAAASTPPDEPIHIGILITNTARESVRVYDSNPWYQNRPQLTRDGNAVAYSENIRELIRQSDSGMLCEFSGFPRIVELKPEFHCSMALS